MNDLTLPQERTLERIERDYPLTRVVGHEWVSAYPGTERRLVPVLRNNVGRLQKVLPNGRVRTA